MSTTTLVPMTDADRPAVARLLHHAFAGQLDSIEAWLRTAGTEHMRVIREDGGGAIPACLLRIPMGQFFGGRSVPMLGIAGVAVAPEARGRGHAMDLMQQALRQGAAEGTPISCLYASTQSLYRRVGFEQAGHRFTTTVELGDIQIRERRGDLRPLTDDDDHAVRACYAAFATPFNGLLDRGPYCWGRIRLNWDQRFNGFGLFAGSTLRGYLMLNQKRDPALGRHDLTLTDFCFSDAEAGRRIWGFLADFATTGDRVIFHGSPLHPALTLLPQQQYTVAKRDYWMLRILDVRRAIEARGYNPAVTAGFCLEVADDLIPANAGLWTIRVRDGHAAAERGGDDALPTLRCHVRGLAAMYSGLYTPRQARLVGLAEGDDRALDCAGAAFACGGTPWMTDMF